MKIDIDEILQRVRERQHAQEERRAALRAAGVAVIRPKPVAPKRLRSLVARVLPWRRPQ